jgi:hypothetical protein
LPEIFVIAPKSDLRPNQAFLLPKGAEVKDYSGKIVIYLANGKSFLIGSSGENAFYTEKIPEEKIIKSAPFPLGPEDEIVQIISMIVDF